MVDKMGDGVEKGVGMTWEMVERRMKRVKLRSRHEQTNRTIVFYGTVTFPRAALLEFMFLCRNLDRLAWMLSRD